jgi:ribonuclease PH
VEGTGEERGRGGEEERRSARAGMSSGVADREDGRAAGQLRPLGCELRPLARCDGSARFNLNKTSCLAGVFGPTEAKASVKESDESIVVVNFNAANGPPGPFEKQSQSIIRQALEAVIVRCR